MKLYYIAPKDLWEAHVRLMADSHHIDLPDGKHVLVAINFLDDKREEMFSEQPSIKPLPHPMSGETIGDYPELLPHLTHLGIQAHHTTWHVAREATKFNRLMKIGVIR